MEIRVARSEDIPGVVELLKKSLGESLMPKSESYWNWKHVQNPFGASPVLLAWEGATLIGVRAFMRWQWRSGETIFRAVRAVDTATHPDHQGKGIFKKLTLSLLDQCKAGGEHFVFNTPNAQSRPGYLKMGWEEAGKLPVCFHFSNPLRLLQNRIKTRYSLPDYGEVMAQELRYWFGHPDLPAFLEACHPQDSQWRTQISGDYLRWRYASIPVAKYTVFGEEKNGKMQALIVGRVKRSSRANEFRITDFFCSPEHKPMEILARLNDFVRQQSIDYCSFSGLSRNKDKALKDYFFLPALAVGPAVTIRNISLDGTRQLKSFTHWSPSLGDLELF